MGNCPGGELSGYGLHVFWSSGVLCPFLCVDVEGGIGVFGGKVIVLIALSVYGYYMQAFQSVLSVCVCVCMFVHLLELCHYPTCISIAWLE